MSRIGKIPVKLPSGVALSVGARSFEVKGPKGAVTFPMFRDLTLTQEGDVALVKPVRSNPSRRVRALHGLVRAHLSNMVEGVTKGFSKTLEIVGTGWTAKQAGRGVELLVGFSHSVKCLPPESVEVKVVSPTEIKISGPDKQQVGQFAADVRAVRPPEPYKGKGIRYQGEQVRRKVGKSMS